MITDKRIVEAIPPRRQWDPRVVSGVKRVNRGEDPDSVALDLAMVVPGFSRTQLGVYTAAYNRLRQKKVKEGLFGGEEPDVADRDNKEQAVQALLGSEDVDVKKVPDEKLTGLIQGLGSITTESIDSQVSQIVSVMREQHASRNDVLEALRVHVGFNLREAKEVLQEYLRENAETLTPGERSYYKTRIIKEATTDIAYYANYLRKQFQGLSFTVAGLDKDMVIHVLAAFQYYFDKEEDPDSAMKILSKKWTSGEWGYTSSKGKIPRAKEAEALPEVVRWYNDFLEDKAGEMTESSSSVRPGVRYGVFSRGGSVGSKHSSPVETFDNVEDAKQYAARLRKMLTPGERSYYRMGYVVRVLKEASSKDEILNIESILKDNFSKVKRYETYFFTPNEDKKLQKFLNPPSNKYINDWRYGYFFEAASILFNKYSMDYKQVENAINSI